MTYIFAANGDFTYAGFLRLQNGLCLTQVSVFCQGKAHAAHGTLVLVPDVAKTRTLIHCGTNSESVTDGPFETMTLGYQVGEGAGHSVELTLRDESSSTCFYRHTPVEHTAGE